MKSNRTKTCQFGPVIINLVAERSFTTSFLLLLFFSFLVLSCWAYALVEIHCTAKKWGVLTWATCWSSLPHSCQPRDRLKLYIYYEISWKIKLNKNCLCFCLPFPCYYVSVVSGGIRSLWRNELKYDETSTLTHSDVMTVTQNSLNLKSSVCFIGWKTILHQSNCKTG